MSGERDGPKDLSVRTDSGLVCPVPAETVPTSAPARLSLSDAETFGASLSAVAEAGARVPPCGSSIEARDAFI